MKRSMNQGTQNSARSNGNSIHLKDIKFRALSRAIQQRLDQSFYSVDLNAALDDESKIQETVPDERPKVKIMCLINIEST